MLSTPAPARPPPSMKSYPNFDESCIRPPWLPRPRLFSFTPSCPIPTITTARSTHDRRPRYLPPEIRPIKRGHRVMEGGSRFPSHFRLRRGERPTPDRPGRRLLLHGDSRIHLQLR